MDLNNITDYLLNKWNKQVVINFLNNLDEFVERIGKNPAAFPMVNPHEHIRKCVISKHNSIYYTDEIEIVEILRVFDHHQSSERLQFLKK